MFDIAFILLIVGLLGVLLLLLDSNYLAFLVILPLLLWPLARNRIFISLVKRGWRRFAARHGLQAAPPQIRVAPSWFMSGKWKERDLKIYVRSHKKVEMDKDDCGRPIYGHLMLSEISLSTPLQREGSLIPTAGGEHLADFVPAGNPRRRRPLTGESEVDARLQENFLVFGFEGLAEENLLSLRHAKSLLAGFEGGWPDSVFLRQPALALGDERISLLMLGEIYRPATLEKLLAFLYDFCEETECSFLRQ